MQSPGEVQCTNKKIIDECYSKNCIQLYDKIYEQNFVSPGGLQKTKEFCARLNLKPNQKVLDVGSGVGGSAFHIAANYGCRVHGIDYSCSMLEEAAERLLAEDESTQKLVSFQHGNIFDISFSPEEFDVIYSREVFLHINDEKTLFQLLRSWLKPGGILFFTTFLTSDKIHTPEFLAYQKLKGYFLKTSREYVDFLQDAQFKVEEASDLTQMLMESVENELEKFTSQKEEFLKNFKENAYTETVDRWSTKISEIKSGDLSWGLFRAKKQNF